MAQKLWRVVRACVDLGPANPIQQIHDQGAGGNCNVVSAVTEGDEGNTNFFEFHAIHSA